MPARQSVPHKRKAASHQRQQLGPYWLWYRADRDDWSVCWYDDGTDGRGRRTCRKSLSISGGDADNPPDAACAALAEHYQAALKPVHAPIAEVFVEKIMADWLLQHAKPNLADPVRYANGVGHWIKFFASERAAGRLVGAPTVADITTALVERFHLWRGKQVSVATRSLVTLRLSASP